MRRKEGGRREDEEGGGGGRREGGERMRLVEQCLLCIGVPRTYVVDKLQC